jgi:hypothetical protein
MNGGADRWGKGRREGGKVGGKGEINGGRERWMGGWIE